MLIATSCLDGVAEGLSEWKATHVVTCTSHRRYYPGAGNCPHLILEFADIEIAWRDKRNGPGSHHVDTLQAFLRMKPERLLVHCAAGLGRSPALAIVALVASGIEPKAACDRIVKLVPEASPNQRLLRIAGNMLGIGFDIDDIAQELFGCDRGIHGALGSPTGLRAEWA